MAIDAIQMSLLKEVAELDALPVGAYNIRANGKSAARNTTANIDIVTKQDKPGIDIIIKPGTKKESVHIPVVLSEAGLKEMVYNDFFIGEDCDVVVIAGAVSTTAEAGTANIPEFTVFMWDAVRRYATSKSITEKAMRERGAGKRVMNPTTEVFLEEGASMEMGGYADIRY